MKQAIRKAALENALKHKGQANPKAILGAILKDFPESRQDTAKTLKLIEEVVAQVNKLTTDKQKEEITSLNPDFFSTEKAKEEKNKERSTELLPLPHAEMGKVVTRIPPEPSKYNHIGHAISFYINDLYAKKYKGKCMLRFDDTNPEACTQEYVDAMQEDIFGYLGIKPDAVTYGSDNMAIYYDYADKLVEQGDAYVCFCDKETLGKNRETKTPCKCRNKKNQPTLWKDLKAGKYKKGEAILSFKGDMEADNAVLRDPVLFRIIEAPHYRHASKYKVWPMYDFMSVIEDHLAGTTHILRSSEFGEMRNEFQNILKDKMGLNKQHIIQYARVNIKDATTQGREIREGIAQGKFTGWDDPRLVTLKALKRRGILPEAIQTVAKQVGLSTAQRWIDFKLIAAINRQLLDPVTPRYLFVPNPEKIEVHNAPKQSLVIPLHPENDLGSRTVKTSTKFFISGDDFSKMEDNCLYRLKDCLNLRKKGDVLVFEDSDMEEYRKEGKGVFQWVTAESSIDCSVFMPDGSIISGKAESAVSKLKIGSVVQFIRFGFCKKEKEDFFIFTHE